MFRTLSFSKTISSKYFTSWLFTAKGSSNSSSFFRKATNSLKMMSFLFSSLIFSYIFFILDSLTMDCFLFFFLCFEKIDFWKSDSKIVEVRELLFKIDLSLNVVGSISVQKSNSSFLILDHFFLINVYKSLFSYFSN